MPAALPPHPDAPGADAGTPATPPPAPQDVAQTVARAVRHAHWVRALWLAAGALSLALGVLGVFLPLLPTTPFVLLAAYCFAHGSDRVERWLIEHAHFGPIVRDWRANRAVPLRAKQLASVGMVVGCAWAGWALPLPWAALPPLFCAAVATWLWRLPTAAPRGAA